MNAEDAIKYTKSIFSQNEAMLTAMDSLEKLTSELSHYKEFYELMRKACPADYIANHESIRAEAFAEKAQRAIKDMQKREALGLPNYALRVSSLQYFEYFYAEDPADDDDYQTTDKLSQAAIFYSEADAQAAAKRLEDTGGVIAEIFKLPKIL
jgi:hypothetical protein